MPFRDPILGGDQLVRTAMRSPNYSAGVSGWRIARDGSVEFNNGTFRGSLSVGAAGSAHAILANTATGDPIDVYNAAGQLTFSVNVFGVAKSTNPATGISSSLQTGQLTLDDGAGGNDASLILLPAVDIHHQTAVWLSVDPPLGANYILEAIAGSDDGTLKPTLVGNERSVGGSMVQSDQRSMNNLVRMGHFNGTTGPSGVLVVANAASFPIAGAVILFDQTSKAAGIWCSGAFNYGTTTLNGQWLQWSGTAVVTYNNSAVSGTYIAWG